MELQSLLNIGTSQEAVIEVKQAILEILNAKADQTTIRVALKTFVKSVQPTNTMVYNNTFSGSNLPESDNDKIIKTT